MDPNSFVQADLRFLLPVHAGQSIGVVGDAPHLVNTFRSENLTVKDLEMPSGRFYFPVEESSLDHVLIPEAGKNQIELLLQEVVRITKRGGWLFIGIDNAEALHRITKRRNARPSPISISHCRRLLGRSGFVICQSYGVRDTLQHPQYLIPLERAAYTEYFFGHMFSPNSLSAAVLRRFAGMVSSVGLHRILYKHLAIVARNEKQNFRSVHAA